MIVIIVTPYFMEARKISFHHIFQKQELLVINIKKIGSMVDLHVL